MSIETGGEHAVFLFLVSWADINQESTLRICTRFILKYGYHHCSESFRRLDRFAPLKHHDARSLWILDQYCSSFILLG